jgi:uncharacterized membrane protein
VVLGLELGEARLPDLLFDRDQVPDDVARRPFAGRRRLRRGGSGGRREGVRNGAESGQEVGSSVGHGSILDSRPTECHPSPVGGEERRMSIVYNQIANRSLDRIGALSDGLFAIAMTLIVLEIHVPDPATIGTDAQLVAALGDLAPRFLTYLLTFLTLGIFWNGQQTQLSYVGRGNRDLAWLSLLFLALVALFPFTTSLLAEFVLYRTALAVYWLDIALCGLALLAIWTYVERAGLVREDVGPEVGRAIRRRIVIAQILYGIGMVVGVVFGTLPAIAFIVLVQLNFAISPRIWILHKI